MAGFQSNSASQFGNTTLLQKLASAVNGHAATATFACGGTVPLRDITTGSSVTIRWDPRNTYTAQSKIDFPLPDHDNFSQQMFQRLLHHCNPATFGVGGRDILDETYRKAAKLDASDFSTNFHPHDCGILDPIQQILLPSTVKGGQGIAIGPQGVRAELYKLNIYSAPSGKFLSHVDTPRGVMQFGSLVVCLPYQHEGGVLRVKHRGETVDFAWGHTSPQSIQWAAFYGNCEHEVLEVTKGHRITLTYNLYYSSIGNLAQPVSTPQHLPLFQIAREMLMQPQFMRIGGILGFFCHHQYAHSQESGRKSIPGAFKGVDLAVFSAFQALGLKVGIHPIIENQWNSLGGLSVAELMWGPTSSREGDFVENCQKNLAQNEMDCDKGDRQRKHGEQEDSDQEDSDQEDSDQEDIEPEEDNDTIVGTNFHKIITSNDYLEEEFSIPSDWRHKKVGGIIWMNEITNKDFAYATLAYGNEATLSYKLSAAAILVVVPPSNKRDTITPTPPARSQPDVFVLQSTTMAHSTDVAADTTTSPSTLAGSVDTMTDSTFSEAGTRLMGWNGMDEEGEGWVEADRKG